MSHAHKDVVAEMEGLHASHKAVLFQLAHRACGSCGICWPGTPWLVRTSGLSENTVRASLMALEAAGHIRTFWQTKGGRGFATEYIVLPGMWLPSLNGSPPRAMDPAPCPKCVGNRKQHPRSR